MTMAAFKKYRVTPGRFVCGLLLLAWSVPAWAHNGPPFPIITDKKIGPCVLSLWTHPDVGTGTFFVVLSEQHQTCPDNLDIEIGVQPASGRLPEARYHFWRDNKVRGQVQYKSEVHFDAQEIWNVLLILKSVQGGGEATSSVMVTPPGFGRWDLLFYASPFALVAILWLRAVSRQKRKKRSQ